MKRFMILVALVILGSSQVIFSAEGDELPQSTLEGQTFSSQLSSPTDDFSESALPAPSGVNGSTGTDSPDELSHQGLPEAPQHKGILESLNILNIFKKKSSVQQPIVTQEELTAAKVPQKPSVPSIAAHKADTDKSREAHEELSHLSLSNEVQAKGSFSFIKPSDDSLAGQASAQGAAAGMNAPLAGALGQQTFLNKPPQADPDDIAHQSLATNIQGQGFVNILPESEVTEEMKLAVNTSPAKTYTTPDSSQNKGQSLVAMSETDDLSHQALATVMKEQDKDTFYFVKTSGAVPLFDKDFRDFIDYGLGVSVGAGKKLNDNLSLTVAFDMVLLTGDWSQKGDRESLIFGEARYPTDRPGEPSQPVITIEAEESISSEANTGIGYIEGAEAQIINAESLKSIDISTDLYLFPVTINALYKFNKIGKISPYVGGGLGYCLAVRDSDSKALKSSYWDGPDYGLHFNNSQTSNGMLLKLLGGLNIPVYKNMLFVAEANTTMYDLKKFDPILEVSFTKPSNPTSIGGNDVSTWSYEDPKQFGVFDQSFVANFSIGIVMPF